MRVMHGPDIEVQDNSVKRMPVDMKKRITNSPYSDFMRCGILLLKVLRKLSRGKKRFQYITVLATCCTALFAIIGTLWNGCSTMKSNELTRLSNARAEKIYGSQIRPWVQSKPTKFALEKDYQGNTFGKTTVRIVNFTNFNALNVRTDVMYGNLEWIREWQKAKVMEFEKEITLRKLTKEENTEYEYYQQNLKRSMGDLIVGGNESGSLFGMDENDDDNQATAFFNQGIKELQPSTASGETAVVIPVNSKKKSRLTRSRYLEQEWKGSCPPIDDLCSRKNEFTVAIRTIWDNEKGRQFETIDHYVLRCTRSGKGISFTFIPKYLSLEKLVKQESEQ